ncbi:MAG: agmatine deiminase family protein [Methanomicrobium sp.]|nr:agmatine deiminase family protein [Methanomicrobium sp.]
MVKTALIQMRVTDDPEENLRNALSLTKEATSAGAKIICLPELFMNRYFPQKEHFDAGISPEDIAEELTGNTVTAFAKLAKDQHAVIIVPFFEKCANPGQDAAGAAKYTYYNSTAVINSDGTVFPPYHKMHIPYDPYYFEKNYFTEGCEIPVFETTYGRIAVLICYDQWFPESARIAALKGAQAIYYPTALGKIREYESEETAEGDWMEAWRTIQRGHAIANSVWVAAVNRVGVEEGLDFRGGSFICDPFGNVVADAGDEPAVVFADIDFDLNDDIRAGWGFMKNRRPDRYHAITDSENERFLSEGWHTSPKNLPETPKKCGYRMPAEWEPHDAVWLAFPHDEETFEDIDAVEKSYIEIITAIANSGGEEVRLLVLDEKMRARVSEMLADAGADLTKVSFHIRRYADVWFRDYGPIFVIRDSGADNDDAAADTLALTDWVFNAWGGKYDELRIDNNTPAWIAKTHGIRKFSADIVLEGGSIDVNGRGLLLTTKQCLLNENRNPRLTQPEIEEYLSEYLGAEKVIWLNSGIEGDDTDGHIDDIARFVNADTVIFAVEDEDRDCENRSILKENLEILKAATDADGNPLKIVTIPMPDKIDDEYPLPASYTNFYIGNRVVLVPVFGCENDRIALEIIQSVFPDRKVIGIDCRAMVYGLGTIHCVSQQQPKSP